MPSALNSGGLVYCPVKSVETKLRSLFKSSRPKLLGCKSRLQQCLGIIGSKLNEERVISIVNLVA